MAEIPPVEKRTLIDHAQIVVSGFAGLTLGDFFAEYAARVSKWTNWNRVALKAFIKMVFGGIFLWLSSMVTNPRVKKLLEWFGYGSIIGIGNDVLMQLYPGGLWGIVAALTAPKKPAPAPAAFPPTALPPTVAIRGVRVAPTTTAPTPTVRVAPVAPTPAPAPGAGAF